MRLSKVTTKGGDKGMTSLGDGKRVSKNSPHIKTIGLLDELNARLGHASLETQSGNIFDSLRLAQNDVFDLSGELSLASKAKPIFQKDRILEIESEIKKNEPKSSPIKRIYFAWSRRIISKNTSCENSLPYSRIILIRFRGRPQLQRVFGDIFK